MTSGGINGSKYYDQKASRAYFFDYINLLKKEKIETQIEVLSYSISQEDAKHRGLYCYYLARTKDIASLEIIIKFRNCPEKEYVTRALQYYNNPKVIAILIDLLLNDKSPRIRFFAASSLGIIGNKIAIPFLKAALIDNESADFLSPSTLDSNNVSLNASRSLNLITGKKLSIEEWKTIDFTILQKE